MDGLSISSRASVCCASRSQASATLSMMVFSSSVSSLWACRTQSAAYWRYRFTLLIDVPLPRTASGKLRRADLR